MCLQKNTNFHIYFPKDVEGIKWLQRYEIDSQEILFVVIIELSEGMWGAVQRALETSLKTIIA